MLFFNIYNTLVTFILVGIILLVINKTVLISDKQHKIYSHKFHFLLLLTIVSALGIWILDFSPQKALIYLVNFINALTFLGLFLFLDKQLSKSRNFTLFIHKAALIAYPLYLKILAQICTVFQRAPIRVLQFYLIELMKYDIDNQNSGIINILIKRIGSDSICQLAFEWDYLSDIDAFQMRIENSREWLKQLKLQQI